MDKINELRFTNYMKDKVRSKNTIDAYLYDIKYFISKQNNFKQYTYDDLITYFAFLNNTNRNEHNRISTSVSRKVVAIKWLYNYLIHIGVRSDHPLPNGYKIRGSKKKGFVFSDILTPSELNELLRFVLAEAPRYNFTYHRNLVLLSILIYQAITSSELSALKLSHLNLDAGTLYIPVTTGGKGRTLDLHPVQFQIFQQYLPERLLLYPMQAPRHKRLVVTLRSARISVDSIGSMIDKYKLFFPSKKLTAELIRKSVIFNWLNIDKRAFEQVQYYAGHKWPTSTEKYISNIDFNDSTAINNFHPLEFMR
jgi:integrase/recombinase XerD